MLLASFNDSCILAFVSFDISIICIDIFFRRLSGLSLPAVVVVELPLLALNDEQIDAFPKELYPILLNGSSTTLLLFDVDGPASNLQIFQ